MFGKYAKYLAILALFVVAWPAIAAAESTFSTYDADGGVSLDPRAEYGAISKVKPVSPTVTKVRPYGGLTSGFGALSGWNPVTWGPDCWLPMPAKGQFEVGPRVWFARIQGEGRRGVDVTGLQATNFNFDDNLGFKKSGNVLWSIEALYQFRPRWGLRYSFSPINLEATHTTESAFTFRGQTFAGGTAVHSKWDRYQHRAGLFFDISRTSNSLTRLYADWLYIQDKLTVGSALGGATTSTWDGTKSLAVMGLEFDKCLKNYRGNTLALRGKGGVAFFDDTVGYEAEAALNYMIPIKTGRFGFVQGGYRWTTLKKEKANSMFSTTIDGAFLECGFLF